MTTRDRWEDVPEEERVRFLARRAAAGRWPYGAQEGWQRGRTYQPMRPLVLAATAYESLGVMAERLLRLCVDACRRRASTAGELRDVMRDTRPFPLFEPDRPLAHAELLRIARPDVLLSRGAPQFVEFNTSITLYGIPALDRMAAAYARLSSDGTLVAPTPVLQARSAQLAAAAYRRAAGRPLVLIPTWRDAAGQAARLGNRRALRAYLRPTVDAARRSGLDVVVEDLSRLSTDADGRLCAGDKRVDLVFNWFTKIVDSAGGLEVIASALAAGTVELFFPEAMRLLSSKQVMAWLHEDLDRLAPADRVLVADHVPWTAWLGPHQSSAVQESILRRALRQRRDLVLKPAIGSSGNGVVFGVTVDDRGWHALLTEGTQRRTLILQRRVVGDTVRMPFLDPTFGVRPPEPELPFVISPFIVGGRICGVLIRHFGPEHDPRATVINTRVGAVVNTVLLLREGHGDGRNQIDEHERLASANTEPVPEGEDSGPPTAY
ncbi:MAG TPA: hypothetical protein VGO16_15335 [Pseudonocardiaceae bacterium]|jgi:hypothetical protein|nr:hypothetical protein [Pseudonocardiaceae bacterium]